MLSLFHFLFKKKKTTWALVSRSPPLYCGGTLCALGTMLVSVMGVSIHWLDPTMRMLHVQCMAKFFELWLFWV